ncbi:hypothetical protein SCHPADRAFT_944472 [Schizopora paradoxa]|uniref:DUF6534 domain-containing protein n=1 Tax=Schizopora paradoxa TaxID=27342 RepID=A0A0H2R9D0_9AGAM|nr:hypothetical protein SCHPADRAFT_944472 [Schizopora paradoxa]
MDQVQAALVGTFGAAYIGAMVALVLYGITTLQTYFYFIYYPRDEMVMKATVAVLWLSETLHVGFISHFMYNYLITNYGNPASLAQGHWSLYMSVLCNVVIATVVQAFFATKIYSFGKKKRWITGIISFFIVAHFGFGIDFVINLFRINTFSKFIEIKYSTALPFAIAAVIPDLLISGSLCFFLESNKQLVSGFRRTETLINLLMAYAINRALLTSTAAILEIVLYAALPESFAFLAVDFCIGKLYANTLLATLNARKSLRWRTVESTVESGSARSSARSPRAPVPSVLFSTTPVHVEISVARECMTNTDGSNFSNQSYDLKSLQDTKRDENF